MKLADITPAPWNRDLKKKDIEEMKTALDRERSENKFTQERLSSMLDLNTKLRQKLSSAETILQDIEMMAFVYSKDDGCGERSRRLFHVICNYTNKNLKEIQNEII